MYTVFYPIDLQDNSGDLGGVLHYAVLTLIVEDGPVQKVLVDALGAGQAHAWEHVHDGGVVGWVEDPLNAGFILCDLFDVVDCLVEEICGCCS